MKKADLSKFFLALCLFLSGNAYAQPGIEYDRIIESEGTRIATKDGGYLTFDSQNRDYHIIKYKAAGSTEWEKTYRGNQSDELETVIQTADGGYLLGGNSASGKGLDKSENSYDTDDIDINDYWIIKVSANGTKQWDRTFGGTGVDNLKSVLQTADGGYLISGDSNSPASAVKTESAILYTRDYWIVKVAGNGTKQWDQTIGGNNTEKLLTVRATLNGTYLLAGTSSSAIGHDKVLSSRGASDYWLIKINGAGVKVSENVFGGNSNDDLEVFEQTSDGGYILGGSSFSVASGEKTGKNFGQSDYWLVKVNAALDKQWDRTMGGSQSDYLVSVKQTNDGGYILGGTSESKVSGSKTSVLKGNRDLWLIKTGADGAKVWDKDLGAGIYTYCFMIGVWPKADGGYVVHGSANNDYPGGNKTVYGYGLWEVGLLSDSNKKKLSFSKSSLSFRLPAYATNPSQPQSVTLSANEGNPALLPWENPVNTWVQLPTPALGSLPITVDGSQLSSGTYKATITANAPGYERAVLTVNYLAVNSSRPPTLYEIGDQLTLENRPVTFTATAEAPSGQTKIFSLVGAPAGAAINASTGVFKWVPAAAGIYKFLVRVTGSTSPLLTGEEEITVTVLSETANDSIRINAGGGAYTAADGRVFTADQYFTGEERTSTNDTADILNTTDDDLYRSGRAADHFGYAIPVRNGLMKVTLHFAEIYWGVFPGRPGIKGRRRFNVSAENIEKLSSYDIIVEAGGPLRAVQETFEVPVIDGVLNLDFLGRNDVARVSAIEVELLETYNSVTYTPVADAYVRKAEFANTNYGSELTLDCKIGPREDLYRTSYLKFSLAELSQVNSAKFRIYGYNYDGNNTIYLNVKGVENDSWTESSITGANAPAEITTTLGTLKVMQQKSYFEVDITDFAKAQIGGNKLLTLFIEPVYASNNRIVFNSRENAVNPPQLLITTTAPIGSRARRTAAETATDEKGDITASAVFPNPVKAHLSVQIGNQHHENISLQLINAAGKNYNLKPESELRGGGKAEVNISNLSLGTGIYLLKVQSDNASEVLRILVTE